VAFPVRAQLLKPRVKPCVPTSWCGASRTRNVTAAT
jgi:hypothetical protein